MSTLVSGTPSFNDQSHAYPTLASINTPVSLTSFEIILLLWPPYLLTVDLSVLLDPTYNQRKNHPRSQNSFILFRRDFEGQLRARFPDKSYTIHEVSKLAGNQWKMQPDLVKAYFGVLSKLAQERHRLAFPDYVYKPKRTGQRRRVGELSFRNMDRDTFVSRNNRVRARRTVRNANTCSTVQNVDYRADESHMTTVVSIESNVDTVMCESTNNDTCLESSTQESNNYLTTSMYNDTISIELPSPENSCDDITGIDNSVLCQHSAYDPFTFPIPNLFSSTDMFETMVSASSDHTYNMDFFNINTQTAENDVQTWPAE
ncbi:7980_t:CDS:1, partial [Paraglomus occultum]